MGDDRLTEFEFLLGTWKGDGHGHYPTISDFAYREEVVFSATPKPFLTYQQRTWAADDGRPLHVETGYLRMLADGQAELVVAQPTGIAEVHAGRLEVVGEERRVTFVSTAVGCSPAAKSVTAVTRTFSLESGRLAIDLSMAAVGQPMTHHLHSELSREAN